MCYFGSACSFDDMTGKAPAMTFNINPLIAGGVILSTMVPDAAYVLNLGRRPRFGQHGIRYLHDGWSGLLNDLSKDNALIARSVE